MNGYRWALLGAAYIKRVLLAGQMTAAARLEMLEWLTAMAAYPVGAAAVAAVEPADDIGFKIMYEAMSLDDNDARGRATNAEKILLSPATFANLVRLNPSIKDALALCGK